MKLQGQWMGGLVSFFVFIGTLFTPTTIQTHDSTSTITIDTASIIQSDFLGIGAEYDPFHFMPESIGAGFNEHWWEIEKRRIAKLKPNIVRVWYQIDWMEPINDNDDPGTIDWSGMQTESVKMQAVYRVLDYLKSQDIDVILVAGWKMNAEVRNWLGFSGLQKPETSAPRDLEEWAEWVSATLQQLIVNKGYSNIKYVMSYNEPNLGDFETPPSINQMDYYEAMYRAIHNRLVTDGIRSQIKLLGPDESSGLDWMEHAAQNMDDILDIYEGHAYGKDYDSMAAWTAERMAYVQPTGKPLMITEFAAAGDKTTYQNAVELADLMISGMRSGNSGMLMWRLADQFIVDPLNFLDSSAYGTWPWLPESAVPRYTYYTLSLFTRFGGVHSQVLSTETDDPDLHVTSVRRSDGELTVFVVNKSMSENKRVALTISAPINKTINRHLFSNTITPTASATIIPSDASWSGVATSFIDPDLPANSVAVYTSVPEPVQIEVTPGEISAAPGAPIDFDGQVFGAPEGIEWSVVGGSDYGTITGDGRYTAPVVIPAMPEALVKAESTVNRGEYDYAVIRFQVTGLSALGSDSEIQLNWSPAVGASGYHVKRSAMPGGPYTTVAHVNGTEYTDTGLTNGRTYYYVVSAISSAGEGANSQEAAAMPTSNSMQDDFDDNQIDLSQWSVIHRGLRSSLPTEIEAIESNGVLAFQGITGVNYWSGRALESVLPFHASAEEPLIVEVDRISLGGTGTGQRSGLWLYVSGSEYLRFSQNMDTGVWAYNLNGGSDTLVLADDDLGHHTMKLVHDGNYVHIYIDGQKHKSVQVDWSSNMRVVLSAEARAAGDSIQVVYDNLAVWTEPAPAN
ncbi:glycosyl hydrolase [Paenibacillus senegalensis]|uniref:glycosyl hydrolase n=1 Tax=Paenibacillus senegalensis TaxID=1465766 RepID=UPI000287CC40|nr:glycosyl hydrolase [Paenibacillus senegalensis]